MTADARRSVPRTDVVLADGRLAEAMTRLGRSTVKEAVAAAQQEARQGALDPAAVVDAAVAGLPETATSLREVINATGVVLHTNLGRAPLSDAARRAIEAAAGYVDIEFDLATGRRALRGRGTLATLRAAVPSAEDVLVVNNGAAAVLLATTALAAGREVVVSRGELVEIGDGFRLPDLIESTGRPAARGRHHEPGSALRLRRCDRPGHRLHPQGASEQLPHRGLHLRRPDPRACDAAGARRGRLGQWPAGAGSAAARRTGRRERTGAQARTSSRRAATSCSAARRPGWSSAEPKWSSGFADIRWRGRSGWTSSA